MHLSSVKGAVGSKGRVVRAVWALALALALALVLALAGLAQAGCKPSKPSSNNNNGSDRCPAGYLLVPGGTFTVGVDEADLEGLLIDYDPTWGPAHKVTLTQDFCMGAHEVTVAEYRSCVDSGTCTEPWPSEQDDGCNYSATDQSRNEHPVNCITYDQARQYCQAQGGDLLTEAQWFRAAQGDDRRRYAWGNSEPDCSKANYDVNGPNIDAVPNGYGCAERTSGPYTWEVGSAPKGASPYGLLDMTGNVFEWVLGCKEVFVPCDGDLGCIDPQPTAACEGTNYRASFGYCFSSEARGLYTFERTSASEPYSTGDGVRCAREAIDL